MSAAPGSDQKAQDEARIETLRLVSYIVIGLVSAFFFVESGSLPASRWEPLGAGSFPRIICGAMIVLCAVAAVVTGRNLRKAGVSANLGAALPGWAYNGRLAILLFILFAGYLAIIRPLGFAVATFVFLLAAYLLLAPRTARAAVIGVLLAAVFSFGLNWLFAEVFNVFLPRASG